VSKIASSISERRKILKVLFIARQLNIGGAERQLVTLANDLVARGHEIIIASFYTGGALSKKLDSGVRLVSLEKRSRWDLMSLCINTVRVVRQERPDVVHGWMFTPDLMATVARIFNPQVKLFWSVRVSNLDTVTDWMEKVAAWLEAKSSRFANCIVVNSLTGLEHAVSAGYPRDKMLFIPNGIDTNTFYPDEAGRERVRAEWGVGPSEKVVGNIARFDWVKNHPLFLKAAARIAAERPDVHFVCVGHGEAAYLAELQGMTRSLGIEARVRWIQAEPDVRAVYNALDVFCSSSSSEGFPNGIGEAMACGRRCVVTNAGDSALLVGDTGVVVPVNDLEALTAGLMEQVAAADSLSWRARQRILDNFTVEKLGDKTEQALLHHVRQRRAVYGEAEPWLGRSGSAKPAKPS
jgi:glycosyltransferase involved in cell wall biosynthesis